MMISESRHKVRVCVLERETDRPADREIIDKEIKDLNNAMVSVVGETVRAQGVSGAIQAVEVALALVGDAVESAGDEEARIQQGLQPWRPVVVIIY